MEVSVDWTKATTSNATITISSASAGTLTLTLPVTVRTVPAGFKGFVEGDGVVSIEAEHFTASNAVGGSQWSVLPGYGKTLGAITLYPVLSKFQEVPEGEGSNLVAGPSFAAGSGPSA